MSINWLNTIEKSEKNKLGHSSIWSSFVSFTAIVVVSNVNIQWFLEIFVTSQFTRSNAGKKVPYVYQNIIFASQVNCM